ncbi:MAG: hypothetical protein E7K78_01850 [Haemophilus haemolyticus]|nr:hypothetical protein [Haemophilus haemolyticus]
MLISTQILASLETFPILARFNLFLAKLSTQTNAEKRPFRLSQTLFSKLFRKKLHFFHFSHLILPILLIYKEKIE